MKYELYFGYDSCSSACRLYKIGTYKTLKEVNARIEEEKAEWKNPFRLSTMTMSKVIRIEGGKETKKTTTLYVGALNFAH